MKLQSVSSLASLVLCPTSLTELVLCMTIAIIIMYLVQTGNIN